MSVKTWMRGTLAIALLASSGAVFAQSNQGSEPTVDSIVNALKSNNDQAQDEQTRALRPGAASMATTAPAAAPEAAPAPAAAAAPKPKPRANRGHGSHVATSSARASTNMTINFEFNSDQISGDSQRTMATLAEALASPQLSDRKFTVVGHTDAKGSGAYNLSLSERRAAAVRTYLVEHGIDADRLTAEGKGESQLLNPRNPNSGMNRRVEIIATGR